MSKVILISLFITLHLLQCYTQGSYPTSYFYISECIVRIAGYAPALFSGGRFLKRKKRNLPPEKFVYPIMKKNTILHTGCGD